MRILTDRCFNVRRIMPVTKSWTTLTHILLTIIIALATAARLLMSLTLHMWYPSSQVADDRLLMNQSFSTHFIDDNSDTLAKNQGYSFWVNFFSGIGLNADIAQFCIWMAASIVMGMAVWKIFHNAIFASFTYGYILWNPLAFENWLGLRMYRNSLYPPLIFFVMGLILLWLNAFTPLADSRDGRRKEVETEVPHHADEVMVASGLSTRLHIVLYAVMGIVMGLGMAELLLLKEDSLWLVPLYVFVLFYKLFLVMRHELEMGLRIMVILVSLLPSIVTFGAVSINKAVNQRYFGVYLLNTRTEGELAGFTNRIYAIDSPDQNTTTWAPPSSLKAAIANSPTLRSDPKLIDALWHGGFAAPNMDLKPIRGDFLTWQIRIAVTHSSHGWKNEASVQRLFARVNAELDRAFATGKLKKTQKISLSPSLVPRSKHQILELVRPTAQAFRWNFDPRPEYTLSKNLNSTAESTANVLGLRKMGVNIADPNPEYCSFLTRDRAIRLASKVNHLYVWMHMVLLLLFALALVSSLCRLVLRKRAHWRFLSLGVLLMLYALAYCFSVTWFTQYIDNDYVTYFYATGSTGPLVDVALLLGVATLLLNWRLGRGESAERQRSGQHCNR